MVNNNKCVELIKHLIKKLLCYRELKIFYGLKQGGDRKSEDFKSSTERLMTEAEIAKEIFMA